MPRIHLKPVVQKFTAKELKERAEARRLPSRFIAGYVSPREYRMADGLKDIGYSVLHCGAGDAKSVMKMARDAEKRGYKFVGLFSASQPGRMFHALVARSPYAKAPRSHVVVQVKHEEAEKAIRKMLSSRMDPAVFSIWDTATGFDIAGFSDEVERAVRFLFKHHVPFSVTHKVP